VPVERIYVDHGLTGTNPGRLGLPQRERREPRVLTPAGVEALAEAVAELGCPTGTLVVRTAAWTGLKAGELAGPRAGRVDLAGIADRGRGGRGSRRALVAGETKTGRVRTVPLPERLVPLLERQVTGKAATELVFHGQRDGPRRHSWFCRRFFRPACERIGRPDLRFHDLRHTCESWLVGQGVHPRAAIEVRGRLDAIWPDGSGTRQEAGG
jgi:integrase